MLPQKHRIPRKLFGPIQKSGKFLNSRHFSLRIAGGDDRLFAVSVSKKVSKSAVVRNKVRRRAYSTIRSLMPSIPQGTYLLVAKPGSEGVKGEVLEKELAELFKKL